MPLIVFLIESVLLEIWLDPSVSSNSDQSLTENLEGNLKLRDPDLSRPSESERRKSELVASVSALCGETLPGINLKAT